MSRNLQALIEQARQAKMTDAQREEQRQTFAYGNAAFENAHITRELVRQASVELRASSNAENKPAT